MTMKPKLISIAAAGLIVALSGCSSSTSTKGGDTAGTASPTSAPMAPATPAAGAAPSASAAAPLVITIKDFRYTVPVSVPPGATVTVKNADAQNHTLTSAPKGTFEVTANGGGGTKTFTAPTKPGSYTFICTFHADMMGTLVVT